jgi:hypothetical protein
MPTLAEGVRKRTYGVSEIVTNVAADITAVIEADPMTEWIPGCSIGPKWSHDSEDIEGHFSITFYRYDDVHSHRAVCIVKNDGTFDLEVK